MDEEQAVGLRDIAEMLNVSTDTVRRRAVAGELPGFRVGRQWRFWPSQVREHLTRAAEIRDPWARTVASRAALQREARKARR